MSNQTIKNDPDNKGRDKLDEQLRSIWLPKLDSNQAFLSPKFKARFTSDYPCKLSNFCAKIGPFLWYNISYE